MRPHETSPVHLHDAAQFSGSDADGECEHLSRRYTTTGPRHPGLDGEAAGPIVSQPNLFEVALWALGRWRVDALDATPLSVVTGA